MSEKPQPPEKTTGGLTIVPISVAYASGGKQWLLPYAFRYFRAHPCETLIEPFAGSGVVGLSLLHAGIIQRLVLVEKDDRFACLLHGIVNDGTIAERYAAFECVLDKIGSLYRTEETAFRYLVQSRVCNRGRFDGGLRNPVHRRWARDMVVRNIQRVQQMRDRITIICGDALQWMESYVTDPYVGCYADPPYSADPKSKGRTIYRYHKLNHKRLFALLAAWRGSWLLTEDNTRTVRRLSLAHRFAFRRVRMNSAENQWKSELMIWRKRRIS